MRCLEPDPARSARRPRSRSRRRCPAAIRSRRRSPPAKRRRRRWSRPPAATDAMRAAHGDRRRRAGSLRRCVAVLLMLPARAADQPRADCRSRRRRCRIARRRSLAEARLRATTPVDRGLGLRLSRSTTRATSSATSTAPDRWNGCSRRRARRRCVFWYRTSPRPLRAARRREPRRRDQSAAERQRHDARRRRRVGTAGGVHRRAASRRDSRRAARADRLDAAVRRGRARHEPRSRRSTPQWVPPRLRRRARGLGGPLPGVPDQTLPRRSGGVPAAGRCSSRSAARGRSPARDAAAAAPLVQRVIAIVGGARHAGPDARRRACSPGATSSSGAAIGAARSARPPSVFVAAAGRPGCSAHARRRRSASRSTGFFTRHRQRALRRRRCCG